MDEIGVGSIVKCRDREWIVLPPASEGVVTLRPLAGSESEVCSIYKPLIEKGLDLLEPATFPLPSPEHSGDAVGVSLLWNAARLSLRDGAAPFRSLGRISVRPRPYQFVPLLMSLRLDPIRLLIADDVGIGKTIESLLIAREMIDRGEIDRLCVICPPYLCDQWKTELAEKFHIDAVVIRSGTVGQLEREIPSGDTSVFSYYPYIVVSIDYVKSKRNRSAFLMNCPKFIIVDEAHGAAQPSGKAEGQQQRHKLLKCIASKPDRHIVLLTATPHSGVEESFKSLLGLLDTSFAELDLQKLSEKERIILSQHFVQRRRADIEKWFEETGIFPERESEEVTYILSPKYSELFKRVYEFSRDIVKSGETLKGWKQRIRFWTALALLRCVMSSPAAAASALKNFAGDEKFNTEPNEDENIDDMYTPFIYEPTDDDVIDVQPARIMEEGGLELVKSGNKSISGFSNIATQIWKVDTDNKIIKCAEVVRKLIKEGYNPIIWCRYIATSDYVANKLNSLCSEFSGLKVMSINGSMTDEERRERVKELGNAPKRILVATDCLSEGINLQDEFNAVVHYDLPWNPNRLEQREGRVDRFGQKSSKVKAVLLYGRDNPVDGAVLEVLLRKAKEIRRTLGITVPVPIESKTVMEAVLKTLFNRSSPDKQLSLTDFIEFEEAEISSEQNIKNVHKKWDEAVAREKENRTRFAQRAINPDEIDRELKETDNVLGDPNTVMSFVLNSCQRLGASSEMKKKGVYRIHDLNNMPRIVQEELPQLVLDNGQMDVCFSTPTPDNAIYLGRNHPFVSSLAQFMLEEAILKHGGSTASRCGVIRSSIVPKRTTLLLLRCRYTIKSLTNSSLLAEEVVVSGYNGSPGGEQWISENDAIELLKKCEPEANISDIEREEVLIEVRSHIDMFKDDINEIARSHANVLEESHRRIRSSIEISKRGFKVQPFLPPDLLGILIIIPVPKGVKQ